MRLCSFSNSAVVVLAPTPRRISLLATCVPPACCFKVEQLLLLLGGTPLVLYTMPLHGMLCTYHRRQSLASQFLPCRYLYNAAQLQQPGGERLWQPLQSDYVALVQRFRWLCQGTTDAGGGPTGGAAALVGAKCSTLAHNPRYAARECNAASCHVCLVVKAAVCVCAPALPHPLLVSRNTAAPPAWLQLHLAHHCAR